MTAISAEGIQDYFALCFSLIWNLGAGISKKDLLLEHVPVELTTAGVLATSSRGSYLDGSVLQMPELAAFQLMRIYY